MENYIKSFKINHFLYIVILCCLLTFPFSSLTTCEGIGQISPPVVDTWISNSSYYAEPTKGNGTKDDPLLIENAANLAYLAKNPSILSFKWVSVTSDIDLKDHLWEPIVGSHSTIIEGNGHTISNIKIQKDTQISVGFFNTWYELTLSNLNFTNVSVVGTGNVAAVLGSGSGKTVFTNVSVSGKVSGKRTVMLNTTVPSWVAGIVGYMGSNSVLTNCYNYATLTSESSVSGISTAAASYVNCINYGKIIGLSGSTVSGISANATKVTGCFVSCEMVGTTCLGITSNASSIAAQSGFDGTIISDAANVDSFAVGAIGGGDIKNCFGLAEIFLTAGEDSIISIFGGRTSLAACVSSFVYCNIETPTHSKELRKYKADAVAFADWSISPYINGGYPFPRGMFAVGGFAPQQDVEAYLQSYGFGKYLLDIQTLPNSTYGTDKYVEMGQYPQTYVGSSMNTTLEGWYSGKTVVDTYTVDNGTSATPNVYNAYTYTDGKTYIRVPTPGLYSTSYTYEDGTTPTTSASWFKVEPIKWLILNYTDFQNGAAPVVIAEKGLASKVTWNKATADGNLWSVKSNIRSWLNGTFYHDAFSSGDKGNIVNTTLQNNKDSDTDGTGDSTTDKVWLLSNNEAFGKYFTTNTQRLCSPTDFAVANNCYLYTSTSYPTTVRPNGGTCYFWLRSAYPSSTTDARVVYSNGGLYTYGVNGARLAARPALTLEI